MITNFINLGDFTGRQLADLLDRAIADKALFRAGKLPVTLPNKTLAMIFEKPSLRTRVSFEAAMTHLGGHALYLTGSDIGLGSREPVQDIARVLGRMCDGIMARTFSHEFVEQLGQWASVPVINALTDYSHPCQAMADLMTAQERIGKLAGKTLAFVGDGNNVARSLAIGCAKLDMQFILACPKGYELADLCEPLNASAGKEVCTILAEPRAAVEQANIVYTDTWVSMGQESEKSRRQKDFAGFQLNGTLMAKAPTNAIVMHCLPAYRGYEITDDVFETHADTILEQAENRLHFQRTLLNVLLAEGGIA